MSKRYDLIGQTFGRLTVLEKGEAVNQRRTWLCKCECGNYVTVTTGNLNSGQVKSCGCMWRDSARRAGKSRFIDMVGRIYDRLTVIKLIEKGSNYTLWECECECGKIVEVRGGDLRSGNTQSCGCLHLEVVKEQGEKHADNITSLAVEGTHLGMLTSKLSKRNTSGVKGVYWNAHKGKWEAILTFQKKRYYLGAYDKIEDATRARKEAEDKYHKPILEKYKGK